MSAEISVHILHQIDAIVYVSLLFTFKLQEVKTICYKTEAFDLSRKGSITPPHLPHPSLSTIWPTLNLQLVMMKGHGKTTKFFNKTGCFENSDPQS